MSSGRMRETLTASIRPGRARLSSVKNPSLDEVSEVGKGLVLVEKRLI